MNIQDKINILSKYNEDCIVGGGSARPQKLCRKEEGLLFINRFPSFVFWSKGGTI